MTGPSLGLVTLLVADYDEALAWYRDRAGFALIEDADMGGGKRWVVIAPSAGSAARLLLAKAVGADQQAVLGKQAGGRVAFFLHTDDFARDHAGMVAKGVNFREAPRRETYGTVAVFEDLYGNPWDLIEHVR